MNVVFDVERSDYVRTPGRSAVLQIGPLSFWMNTADGLLFGFDLKLTRRWRIAWTVESEEPQ